MLILLLEMCQNSSVELIAITHGQFLLLVLIVTILVLLLN